MFNISSKISYNFHRDRVKERQKKKESKTEKKARERILKKIYIYIIYILKSYLANILTRVVLDSFLKKQ